MTARHAPVKSLAITAATFGALISATSAAASASAPPVGIVDEKASNKDLFTFDYGVPSSPALNLMGLSPDKTTMSSSLKPFVLSLPSLFSGGADQSAALDIAPLWLLGDNSSIGYNKYVTGPYAQRFKYRFRTEMALYTGNDGGGDSKKVKASQLAFGFSASLLDASDPLTATFPGASDTVWSSCLGTHEDEIKLNPSVPADVATQLNAALTAGDQSEIDRLQTKITEGKKDEDARALKAVQACTDEANKYARFAPNLSVGAGANLQGTPGTLGGFKTSSAVLWLSGKYPLGTVFGSKQVPDTSDGGAAKNGGIPETSYWMVGGSARAGFGTMVSTGDTATPQIKANTFDGWIGLERNSSWLVLSAQAGYQDVSATNAAQDTFSKSGWRWLTSASLKLSSAANGIWLDASYGSAHGTTQTFDDKTFMLSLNFGPANPANLFGENSSPQNDNSSPQTPQNGGKS